MYAIAEVGSRIIVGGSFTSVSPPGVPNGGSAVTRNFILAFNSSTGAVDTGFAPVLDGEVDVLKPGPTPDTVYVGGAFKNLNGAKGKGITLISTVTGLKVAGWTSPPLDGIVYGIARSANHLIIGGTFTVLNALAHSGIGSINATTGAVEDSYITTQLTGHHNYNGSGSNGGVGPRALDISPDGTQVVVVGNFKQADGVTHDQIALFNLSPTAGTLNTGFNTLDYTAPCANWAFDTYMRDVSFSPDGSYFAIAATGGNTFSQNIDGSRSLCDTTTRWEANSSGANVQPTWITYTGNDSMFSVVTTGTAVYVGGHQRWTNNAQGSDSAGPGAAPRPGLMALNPVNGVAYGWNPGRNPRGSGAFALLATSTGLYVGSDTDAFGNGPTYASRGRIGFFPLTGGASVPAYSPATLPASVYLAGQLPVGGNSNVLYRVNAAGSPIPALDNGPDWEGDTGGPSYHNPNNNIAGYNQVANIDSTVPASTPSGIFNSERWDGGSHNDGDEMTWTFPVTAGTPIEVRLYFANRYTGTDVAGQRVFDVTLNGTTVLDHYDIVADAGTQTGHMRAFDINAPASGNVTISFLHEVENPLVNGIEIVRTDIPPPGSGAFDTLRTRPFTGTTTGAVSTLSPGSIAWGSVRGAFVAGDTLFYGYSDGKLYRAPFDGTTVGTPSLVDPYNDPIWSDIDTGSGQTYRGIVSNMYGAEMQSVSGMVLFNGRLYFATAGSASLHWRGFEPDSGLLTEETLAGGNVNLSNISGMFLAGNTLYYASKATGDLHAVAWNNGAPDAGTDTIVSGPSTDGNDWRARALFARPALPPVAAFTSSCSQLSCSFDATASTAPGGSVASYAWDYGDGNTDTGATPTHVYASAGSYSVTLTVTSSLSTTASVSHIVQPFVAVPSTISFVGATHVTGNVGTMTVNVPANVQTGDGLLLMVSGANVPTITGPAGWTLVGTSPGTQTSITTQVYKRVATATDAGATVSVGFSGTPHSTLEIVAYRGVSANFVASAAVSSASNTTTINSATGTTAAGTWVVTFYSAKSSTVTGWTVGGAQTSRDVDNGTGSGRTNSVVVDSGDNVPPGPVGNILGTTDVTYSGATAWTIVIQ